MNVARKENWERYNYYGMAEMRMTMGQRQLVFCHCPHEMVD
jgi:hypothetical protein